MQRFMSDYLYIFLLPQLDEWFTRTKLPVIALALDTSVNGDIGVRFIGGLFHFIQCSSRFKVSMDKN